jgi:hypothetical protein
MNISFRPTPDYAALFEAAAGLENGQDSKMENATGRMKGLRIQTVGDL